MTSNRTASFMSHATTAPEVPYMSEDHQRILRLFHGPDTDRDLNRLAKATQLDSDARKFAPFPMRTSLLDAWGVVMQPSPRDWEDILLLGYMVTNMLRAKGRAFNSDDAFGMFALIYRRRRPEWVSIHRLAVEAIWLEVKRIAREKTGFLQEMMTLLTHVYKYRCIELHNAEEKVIVCTRGSKDAPSPPKSIHFKLSTCLLHARLDLEDLFGWAPSLYSGKEPGDLYLKHLGETKEKSHNPDDYAKRKAWCQDQIGNVRARRLDWQDANGEYRPSIPDDVWAPV